MALSADAFLQALLSLPKVRTAKVSPDGKWVAWEWLQVGPYSDVYVASSDGLGEPQRLTNSSEDTWLVNWAPDGQSLLVEQDKGGDERFALYQVKLGSPGHMEPLTELSPAYFLRGGQLDPTGQFLIYGANVDVQTGQVIEATTIIRHDLKSGERVALATPNKGAYTIPYLSPKAKHVLYERKDLHPSGRQVWLVDADGQNDREILNCGADKKVEAQWSHDGSQVVYLEEAEGHRRVGTWSLESGDCRLLIDDPSRNIEAIFCPKQSPLVVVMEIVQSKARCTLLDLQTGAETSLNDVPGSLRPLAPTEGGKWLFRYHSSQQPTSLMVADLGHFDPDQAASICDVWKRTEITAGDLAAAEDYRWKAEDGLDIQGWLFRPQKPAKGTVLYVHGGPTAHASDALMPEVQFYVSQGLNVLCPNYRGSTGFGLAFQESIKEDGWGGREQGDIRSGIRALLKDGIAQAGRVGITGTSYGGYSSWCAITRFTRWELAASAPCCGMTDLVVDYHTTRPDLRPYSEEMMGGTPEQVPERYHKGSPMYFVNNMVGELLIIQGSKDPNVTMDNVSSVSKALDSAGKSYEIMAFGDEGHGIRKPHNLRRLYPHLVHFFVGAFDRASADLASWAVQAPVIEHNEGIQLVGYESSFIHVLSPDYSGPSDLGPLWERFIPASHKITSRSDEALYGACYSLGEAVTDQVDKAEHVHRLAYMAGAAVKSGASIPEGMVLKNVGPQTYAKFVHVGPISTLRRTVEYAYQVWLQGSKYEHAGSADLEVYGERFNPGSEQSELGYWIPVTAQ